MNCKKLLIAVLFLFITVPSFAQLLPFSLEVRGGINRSEASIKHIDTKNRISYRADAVLDFKMGLGVFTRTGLTLTEKNTKIDIPATEAKITARYLEVPAMLGYKLSIPMVGSVNAAGGMYFGYGVGGKTKVDGEKENTFSDVYKKFDTGLAVSAGVEIRRTTLNVGYEHGLLNVGKHGMDVKNRSVYATLGFRIF